MYDFDYHRPTSVAEASDALKSHPDARLIAGGMTLVPTLKLRLAKASHLVDLAKIAGLAGIESGGGAITIGAMTTHAEVANSPKVRAAILALADLASGIGDPHVRHCGTLGGSVANNDPAADYPAALLALGATVRTNLRDIAADAFFTGMFETALKVGEVITSVQFPIPEKAAYVKFRNPPSRYALVGVFAAAIGGSVRVAVTGAAQCVFRHADLETAIATTAGPAPYVPIVKRDGLLSDIHGTAEYRAHLVGVLAQRAVDAMAMKSV